MIRRWNSSMVYSAKSAYNILFLGSIHFAGANILWKTWVPPKVKFFGWLSLHDRLWTAARRKRHGLQPDDLCTHYLQTSETTNHLLLHCILAHEVWWRVLGTYVPAVEISFLDRWSNLQGRVASQLRKGIDFLLLLTALCI